MEEFCVPGTAGTTGLRFEAAVLHGESDGLLLNLNMNTNSAKLIFITITLLGKKERSRITCVELKIRFIQFSLNYRYGTGTQHIKGYSLNFSNK
jgi:hypothetical protein